MYSIVIYVLLLYCVLVSTVLSTLLWYTSNVCKIHTHVYCVLLHSLYSILIYTVYTINCVYTGKIRDSLKRWNTVKTQSNPRPIVEYSEDYDLSLNSSIGNINVTKNLSNVGKDLKGVGKNIYANYIYNIEYITGVFYT